MPSLYLDIWELAIAICNLQIASYAKRVLLNAAINIVSIISQDEMPRRGQQRVLVQGQVRRGGGGRHQVTHYLQYLLYL